MPLSELKTAHSLNINGQLLSLATCKLMGILNITPDSFYDGGKYNASMEAILQQAEILVSEGADILDIGGMSSRPGAAIISPNEELERVVPVIEQLNREYPSIPLSIDTVHATVAKAAVQAGAGLVNDISAGNIDNKLLTTVGNLQVPYVLMHMQGTPETMQHKPSYSVPIIEEVANFFRDKILELRALGVKDIILDVGFGFGKTIQQNFALLAALPTLTALFDLPIMVGISRKSMLYNLLGTTPNDALNATTAAHVIALLNGTSLLRVHDVKAAKEAVQLVSYYQNQAKSFA